ILFGALKVVDGRKEPRGSLLFILPEGCKKLQCPGLARSQADVVDQRLAFHGMRPWARPLALEGPLRGFEDNCAELFAVAPQLALFVLDADGGTNAGPAVDGMQQTAGQLDGDFRFAHFG